MNIARSISTGCVWAAIVGVVWIVPQASLGIAICGLIATMFIWRSA